MSGDSTTWGSLEVAGLTLERVAEAVATTLGGLALESGAPADGETIQWNAAASEFQYVAPGAPSAHVLASTSGLGASHTVSGLTAGQVLRASSATNAAFTALTAADIAAGTFPVGAFVFADTSSIDLKGSMDVDPNVTIVGPTSIKTDNQGLYVASSLSAASGTQTGFTVYSKVAGGGSGNPFGAQTYLDITGATAYTGVCYGLVVSTAHDGSALVDEINTLNIDTGSLSTGDVTIWRGIKIDNFYQTSTGGVVTEATALYISAISGTGATNHYAIYSNAGKISFGDTVEVRSGVLLLPSGSVTAPALQLGVSTLGFYRITNTEMGVAAGSSQILDISTSGLGVNTIFELTLNSGVTVDGVLVKDGGATLTAPLKLPAATISAPAIYLGTDSNSGWYQVTDGAWHYSRNGTLIFQIGQNGNVSLTGGAQLEMPADGVVTFGGTAWIVHDDTNSVLVIGPSIGNPTLSIDEGVGTTGHRDVIVGETSQLATTATGGFLLIPGGAGAPTGTPTNTSPPYPLYYDATNNELYVYNGSWRSVALA